VLHGAAEFAVGSRRSFDKIRYNRADFVVFDLEACDTE